MPIRLTPVALPCFLSVLVLASSAMATTVPVGREFEDSAAVGAIQMSASAPSPRVPGDDPDDEPPDAPVPDAPARAP